MKPIKKLPKSISEYAAALTKAKEEGSDRALAILLYVLADKYGWDITLASRGWQRASKKVLRGDHAEHVHANCDCTFAIRFDGKTEYAGYEPDRYLAAYESAGGSKPQDKINAMRREKYQQNKDKINEQKRIAYARRTAADQEKHN